MPREGCRGRRVRRRRGVEMLRAKAVLASGGGTGFGGGGGVLAAVAGAGAASWSSPAAVMQNTPSCSTLHSHCGRLGVTISPPRPHSAEG